MESNHFLDDLSYVLKGQMQHDQLQFPLREFEDIDDYFPYVTDQIPTEHAILGIDAIQLRVQYSDATERELLSVGWQHKEYVSFFSGHQRVTILENQDTQFYQEVQIIQDRENPVAIEGIGSVHHVAFGVENKSDLQRIDKQLQERNFINSGIKDREFLYHFIIVTQINY